MNRLNPRAMRMRRLNPCGKHHACIRYHYGRAQQPFRQQKSYQLGFKYSSSGFRSFHNGRDGEEAFEVLGVRAKGSRYGVHKDMEQRKKYIMRRIDAFRKQLESPDHVLIGATRARSEYGLTRKHLSKLTPVRKSEGSELVEELYWLPDIVALSRAISDEQVIIDRFRHYLESGRQERYRRSKIYGMNQMEKGQVSTWVGHLWYSRKDNEPSGADVVWIAIKQNLAICVVKLGVAGYTGSSAVFADAMHSVADVINAMYRYIGINLATRDPDYRHPYGYNRLRYVFTDRSSLILLGIGGILPLIHGIKSITEPPQLTSPLAMGLLFTVVGVLETPALIRSYNALRVRAQRARRSLLFYLWEGNDMINITTFAECGLGVIAAGVGVASSFQYWLTGETIYDSYASVFMASTVVLGSALLLSKNAKALVGETLPVEDVEYLIFKLEEDDVVDSVHDVKTEVLGLDTVRFKAEIEFNAEAITRKIMNLYEIPSDESKQLFDDVSLLNTEVEVEDWVMKNNAMYQTALSSELQRIENIVKSHLAEAHFKNFYIDLELW
mmetsp:Transcript_27336/g.66478  ORF Transcript_27336/g.66478 Transcript_27336/m.66478 type:complete len:554 (-) Transcript_27336:229-1890(-)|eukprot:CAMPEP_0114514184 /NCGR_PEP_ID=MMETSP0109-20121206/16007_1 /TAXON_ID=29199 /ORGANISM="Chlorarachnion reptans, Strain CCCM449" /LENGTH=553 /DNA_ID=CAMNT_0001694185 /DNA_START=274 /DNA_END=1935 /DNA_ORIENTATION=+